MALTMIILLIILVGIIESWIYGKEGVIKIIVPIMILSLANFLLVYGKILVGDNFSTIIFCLSSIPLIIVSGIWLLVVWMRSPKEKGNNRKKIAIVFSLLITFVILFIPPLNHEDKFNMYKEDYFAVSDAIFQAYDQEKLPMGKQINTSELNRFEDIFPKTIINKMKKLNDSAGVYAYIVADKDVIYFSFGATFQSIDGIAICRNNKDPSRDTALKARFFDRNTEFTYITDNVYQFFDGL
ncbi:hypothetical protein RCG17_23255 [Neobacillus sp. PS3-12]|uniref:hypothetical protein n=1 Tax=Neobacillus sp. PS3-12 TaxID=3070677 RepID=UPI0027DF0C78|nr:hypothetical protein [Neobacillus sp. PS3-12]WML52270.1 hypothetical protein RCG17_23255 [Neobacillus sp. PS3-12]